MDEITKQKCEEYFNSMEFSKAWEKCENAEWLLYIAEKSGVNDRALTLARGMCADTVRHRLLDKEIIVFVDAAIAYGHGQIDEKEMKSFAEKAKERSIKAYNGSNTTSYNLANSNMAYYLFPRPDGSWVLPLYTSDISDIQYKWQMPDSKSPAQKHNEKICAEICKKYLTSEII